MSTASKTCPGGSRSHTCFTLFRSSIRSPVQSILAGHFWIPETSDIERLGALTVGHCSHEPESTLGDECPRPANIARRVTMTAIVSVHKRNWFCFRMFLPEPATSSCVLSCVGKRYSQSKGRSWRKMNRAGRRYQSCMPPIHGA